jgi:DUF1365 family protein
LSLNSALYAGTVRHTRLEPFRHSFKYRVFYGLFDLDELDLLDEGLRWFSVGRWNLVGFHPSDYGPADGGSLREWVEDALGDAGVDLEGGRIMVLTFPRILGHVFNPLTIWYGYGPDGDLRGVIHEVRNTFGDRHSYVVPVGAAGLKHSFGKELHVSPFNGMDQAYRFSLTAPGKRVSVSIEQFEDEQKVLLAGMALSRRPLTDGHLMRVFFTHPLVTLKVVSAIHWQALKLWIKGATFHRRPEPRSHNISIVDATSPVA